jgi:hypothetical protein
MVVSLLCVVKVASLRRADRSFRGVLPAVCVCVCVCVSNRVRSRSLKNETSRNKLPIYMATNTRRL